MKGPEKVEPFGFSPSYGQHTKQYGIETRINPEISKAIKRQRETVGVDYWKTNKLLPAQRRATSEKINNLRFEFSNGLLPAISPSQKGSKPCAASGSRPKRKLLSVGVEEFSRSNSLVNLNCVPRISDSNKAISSKRTFVSDLTCLQLADTLFSNSTTSYKNSDSFLGRTRYMDYVLEGMKKADDNSNVLPEIVNLPMISSTLESNGLVTFDDIINSFQLDKTVSDKIDNKQDIKHENTISEDNNTRTTKHRSILKHSNSESSLNISACNIDQCNECKKRDGLSTTHHCYCCEPSRCVHSAVRLPGNKELRRTRSVRFNISDEIHEYLSSEPICFNRAEAVQS